VARVWGQARMGVLQAAAAGIRQCIGIKKEKSGHEATRLLEGIVGEERG